jgi:hypothetical protein
MNLIYWTHLQVEGGQLRWYSEELRARQAGFDSRQVQQSSCLLHSGQNYGLHPWK